MTTAFHRIISLEECESLPNVEEIWCNPYPVFVADSVLYSPWMIERNYLNFSLKNELL